MLLTPLQSFSVLCQIALQTVGRRLTQKNTIFCCNLAYQNITRNVFSYLYCKERSILEIIYYEHVCSLMQARIEIHNMRTNQFNNAYIDERPKQRYMYKMLKFQILQYSQSNQNQTQQESRVVFHIVCNKFLF